MMQDLNIKAKQEKYYNSIRYFSHTLPKKMRKPFILEVSRYNIYLAAQCATTGEEDKNLEKQLLKTAEEKAKDFSNANGSAQGFLALAEFQNFQSILSLLASVAKSKSIHYQVFQKILSADDPNIFYQFLDILSNIDNPQLIQNAISAYNGKIHIDSSNRLIFKKIIQAYVRDKHYGTLRITLGKFHIMDEYNYITDESVNIFIEKLLRAEKLNGITLAYELVIANNLLHEFPPSIFITKSLRMPGIKGILFAIKLSEKHIITYSGEIEQAIEKMILPDQVATPRAIKKSVNLLKRLLKKGGSKYLKNVNNSLLELITDYILNNQPSLRDHFLRTKIEKSILGFQMDTTVNKNFEDLLSNLEGSIEEVNIETIPDVLQGIFAKYFEDNHSLPIEVLIGLVLKKVNTTFNEISKTIKRFNFVGEIIEKTDYGIYLFCSNFITEKKILMPRKRMGYSESVLDFDSLEKGNTVNFAIASINARNFALEIVPQNKQSRKSRIAIQPNL